MTTTKRSSDLTMVAHLVSPDNSRDELYLGKYIFEGSKPGASAASVWLSHKVLPLNEKGYGYLIERTMEGARRLHAVDTAEGERAAEGNAAAASPRRHGGRAAQSQAGRPAADRWQSQSNRLHIIRLADQHPL